MFDDDERTAKDILTEIHGLQDEITERQNRIGQLTEELAMIVMSGNKSA